MTEDSAQGRVGVTLISGYLGAGKTTLLRRLVQDKEFGPRLALLINDVGELGLDPELVRSAGTAPTLRVTELVSGCICCTLQGEFVSALRTLLRGEGLPRKPEYILIEPSGIARASELSFAINAIGNDEPVQTDAVITLVDAHNAARAFHDQPDLFRDQVGSADLLVINKADLLPDPAARRDLEAWLRTLAPRANCLWTTQAVVDPALLFGKLDLHLPDPTATEGSSHPPTSPHRHAAAVPEEGMAALTLPVPFVVDRDRLEDFLDAQADHIFRIKGIVLARYRSDGSDGDQPVPTLVQAVGDRVDIDPLPADSPLCGAPRRLIFIGSAPALQRHRLSQQLLDTAAETTEGVDFRLDDRV